MRIIFMGTPHFAVPSLDILVKNGYDIVGVITATDKKAGRGHKLTQSAIKKYALANNLPVLQPKNLKSKKFREHLATLKADLQVVVAFRMLPKVIFSMPKYGTFNLHGSLLPQYRGAAPINWAVINGEKETGVTTFFIDRKVDTGNMLFKATTPISETDTAGNVHDRLMDIGANLVLKTVQAIEKGDYTATPQVEVADLKPAPKIFKDTCQINWNQPTEKVYNFIRGLSPYPTAWTVLHDKQLKIFKVTKVLTPTDKPAGTFLSDENNYLYITTADGYLDVQELQLQGRRKMETGAFLRGYKTDIVERND